MTLSALAWLRLATALALAALVVAAWYWLPLQSLTDLPSLSHWIAPYRRAWYALPMVVIAFVILGLLFVPVLLLITATGIAFGPVLGPLYAMAGCLTSASAGFGIGRWVGRDRVRRLAGERVLKVSRTLERNGTLAVFLLRKIPAPFLLANIVIGASRVRFRDFILGTLLGMSAIVIGLAGLGHQLTQAVDRPSWSNVALAVAFIGLPLSLAWIINRELRRRRATA